MGRHLFRPSGALMSVFEERSQGWRPGLTSAAPTGLTFAVPPGLQPAASPRGPPPYWRWWIEFSKGINPNVASIAHVLSPFIILSASCTGLVAPSRRGQGERQVPLEMARRQDWSSRFLMNRAGFPATTVHGSTFFMATARAPTTAPSPTVTPGPTKASAQTQA